MASPYSIIPQKVLASKYSWKDQELAFSCLEKSPKQLTSYLADTSIDKNKPKQDIQIATLLMNIYGDLFFEEWIDFWHNHFNVNFSDPLSIKTLPEYDAAIRGLALSNFHTMVSSIGKSPSMLIYLNNRTSKTGGPNENYARELFELHTLGKPHYFNQLYSNWKEVPGALQGKPIGYIDQDIYEAARALTGLTINFGQKTDKNTQLPDTGDFTYLNAWHDPYQKRILAKEFDPNTPPLQDAETLFKLVATHPGTYKYIASKMAQRWLLSKQNEKVLAKLMETQANSKTQLKTLFEFVKQNRMPTLLRPPQFLGSICKALGLEIMPNDKLIWAVAQTGHKLFSYPAPTGHPLDFQYWASPHYIRMRFHLVQNLLTNTFKIGGFNWSPVSDHGYILLEYWAKKLGVRSTLLLEGIIQILKLKPEEPMGEDRCKTALLWMIMSEDFSIRKL